MLSESKEIINKQTSRHIGKVLSFLESAGVQQIVISQVRKEMWFLHDDILELVSKEEASGNFNQ